MVTTIYVGSVPIDLDISPDGTRLYVLNNGSTLAGIGVVDLATLTLVSSLPTPFPGNAIAAGLGNRLYLLNDGSVSSNLRGIAQVDATTGEFQSLLPGDCDFLGNFQMSLDRATLFYGASAGGPFSIVSFDVSTAMPVLLQQVRLSVVGSYSQALTLSHNGKYLVYSGESNLLIPANDLNGVVGTFAGQNDGPTAFSVDDATQYQIGNLTTSGTVLTTYSTQTFDQLTSFNLPVPDSADPPYYTSFVITSSNNYAYIAGVTDISSSAPANLLLVSTRNAPFFDGSVPLSDGFYYLQFPDGTLFGYYNLNSNPYLFHIDLQFEYPIDAADGSGGIYLYDFTSETFFYTSASLFPYLYDFTLNSFLYYYPNTRIPGHYTAYPRYFYNFSTGQIISK